MVNDCLLLQGIDVVGQGCHAATGEQEVVQAAAKVVAAKAVRPASKQQPSQFIPKFPPAPHLHLLWMRATRFVRQRELLHDTTTSKLRFGFDRNERRQQVDLESQFIFMKQSRSLY